MAFPAPASGAGPTTGSITTFTRFPRRYEMLWAPRKGTAGGFVVRTGLDGIRLFWPVVAQAFFDVLQNHYDAAYSAGGLYAVSTWNQTSAAYAARNCVVEMPPEYRDIDGDNYLDVSMDFLRLDRP